MVKSRNLPGEGFCWEGKTAHSTKPRTFGSTPHLGNSPRGPCGSRVASQAWSGHGACTLTLSLQGLSVGSPCWWSQKHTPQTPSKGQWPIPKGIHPYSVSRGGWVSGAPWCRAATKEKDNKTHSTAHQVHGQRARRPR